MPEPKARVRHYIGIDPSPSKIGIAVLTLSDNPPVRNTEKLKIKATGVQRLHLLKNMTKDFIEQHTKNSDIAGVCVEGPSLYSVNKPDLAGQMRGVVYTVCMDCNSQIVPIEIPPSSLKLFATGRGDASKEQMIKTALQQHWTVTSDDEADAAWLAEFACSLTENTITSRNQLEAIRGIRKMTVRKPRISKLRDLNI